MFQLLIYLLIDLLFALFFAMLFDQLFVNLCFLKSDRQALRMSSTFDEKRVWVNVGVKVLRDDIAQFINNTPDSVKKEEAINLCRLMYNCVAFLDDSLTTLMSDHPRSSEPAQPAN